MKKLGRLEVLPKSHLLQNKLLVATTKRKIQSILWGIVLSKIENKWLVYKSLLLTLRISGVCWTVI